MSNKAFIPAFQAKVGDWKYYICVMKYAEISRQVQFEHELRGNADLSQLIQRGISSRTEDIKNYLLDSPHRFLGSMIIAVWGGEPTYHPLGIDDPTDYLAGADDGFGVLSFDGSQSYFALDGQHRLKAIKDAMKENPSLGSEEICVIMVSHFDTNEGREKTRRLFTNINRNAKTTTTGENIALDEDEASSIITRRIIREHPFLCKDGVVKVFTKIGDTGEIKIAPHAVPQNDAKAVTSITALHKVVQHLLFDLGTAVNSKNARPTDDQLEEAYEVVSNRLSELFGSITSLDQKLNKSKNAKELRQPKGNEGAGHALMRPIVQDMVAKAIAYAVTQGHPWEETAERLSKLNWEIRSHPWSSVYNDDSNKMINASENKKLLSQLLDVTLTHSSKAAVKKVRKEFKEIRGFAYPLSEEDMIDAIPKPPE